VTQMAEERITVSYDDLQTRKVETRLKEQEAMARNRAYAQLKEEAIADVAAAPSRPSLWYNPIFTLTVFGLLGGLTAWGLGALLQFKPSAEAQANEMVKAVRELTLGVDVKRLSPEQQAAVKELERVGRRNDYFKVFTDGTLSQDEKTRQRDHLRQEDAWRVYLANVMAYGVYGLLLALALSIAEPATDRNVQGVVINGSVGATLGLVGGAIVALFVERLYRKIGGGALEGDVSSAKQIIARSVTWGVMGLFLTVAPGIVMKNIKRLLIGLAGGLVGGLVGGALYDPAIMLTGRPEVGKLVGLVAIGVLAGVATGLIENAAKKGWVRVITGLIAGKQFILYRNPTYIGSAPDCQIYLFKDKKVGKRHAAIHIVPGGFELEDLPLGANTLVNGKTVKRARLRNGDRVMIGSTCFIFQEKNPTTA
jgi:hypothetical protein